MDVGLICLIRQQQHDWKACCTCREAVAEIDMLVDTAAAASEAPNLADGVAPLGSSDFLEAEGGVEALAPFFTANEGFRGQIKQDVIALASSQVCFA